MKLKKSSFPLIIFVLAIILTGFFVLNSLLFIPNVKLQKDKVYIDVPKNTDIDSLTKILSPYIKSQATFKLASKIKRFTKPHPGRYAIKNMMNNNNLINLLRIGQKLEVKVTFNNKNSIPDLAGAVSHQIEPDSLALLKAMSDRAFIKEKGFTPDNILLMYIPDTYRLYYNTTPEQFRAKMWQAYQKFWNEKRRAKAKKLGLTPIEVGILASIIQKESTKASELPRIAGVYLNRLKKGMLLQADPTVVYAYRQQYGKDLVIKRVLNKHKAVDSPYNTYKYAGLPPGPICMPDIQSIKAVLNPEKHQYYYFVADFNKPGYHLFSKTLHEHNQRAGQYHNQLNRQGIYH